jgi:hypothetical protein
LVRLIYNFPTSFAHQASLFFAVFLDIAAIDAQSVFAAFHSVSIETAHRRYHVIQSFGAGPIDCPTIGSQLQCMTYTSAIGIIHGFPDAIADDCAQYGTEYDGNALVAIFTYAGTNCAADSAAKYCTNRFAVALAVDNAVILLPVRTE